jgi:hypothetical protein
MTFDGGKPETRQIDLNRADWTKYTEAAAAVLEAMSPAVRKAMDRFKTALAKREAKEEKEGP